jgi:hypothetical protein
MRPAPRPPIDMMAWKAMRNREVAEKNNLTPEEKTEYDEEVADSSKFFAERVDELFGIALRKFSVHPADIIDHAFQHMLRHALCMYHLEPDDRDETFSKPVLALLAFLRVDGTKLIVMCRHERPYLDCPECLAITKQDDEAARLEMQSWEDDDE